MYFEWSNVNTFLFRFPVKNRKRVESQYSSLKSDKGTFDWENNYMQTEESDTTKKWMNNPKIKNITLSSVFDQTPQKNIVRNNSLSAFTGSGDIFTWKDAKVEESKISSNRRNPNLKNIREVNYSSSKKVLNKMIKTSKDNFLSSL